MAGVSAALTRGPRRALIVGAVLLLLALSNGAWVPGLIAAGLLGGAGWVVYTRYAADRALDKPWPWPPELRAAAEGLARPIDPTPRRILPPHEDASQVAAVATTKEDLARLIADKPAAWAWAVFTSVLLQRRNAVQGRLRSLAGGYQPRPGMTQVSGRYYTQIVAEALPAISHLADQLDQFMLSPAFTGAFGDDDNDQSNPDADAIVAAANRVMDYHAALLHEAEKCVQTPVESDVRTFVHDAGTAILLPMISFEELITTLCARVAEAQELLPYAGGKNIRLDDVPFTLKMPDELGDRIAGHIARFTR